MCVYGLRLLTQSIRENFAYQITLGSGSLWNCQQSLKKALSTVTTTRWRSWMSSQSTFGTSTWRQRIRYIRSGDKGEALLKDVEKECIKYGVRRETTAGYTPAHNAFIERWFRTNSEMSRCQMIPYIMDDTYWQYPRAMATFIYNRVPPSTRIEGEPWISPLQKQYSKRVCMDMSKIRPFRLACYVLQKKERRNVGYHGKSDKKQHAKKGVLIGYDDRKGTLLVKVYYPKENTYAWIDEQLVTYADPLLASDKVRKGKVLVLPKKVPVF
jgi:hypothetical protein